MVAEEEAEGFPRMGGATARRCRAEEAKCGDGGDEGQEREPAFLASWACRKRYRSHISGNPGRLVSPNTVRHRKRKDRPIRGGRPEGNEVPFMISEAYSPSWEKLQRQLQNAEARRPLPVWEGR